MTDEGPLGGERDTQLGAMLRAHLDGADPAGFAARVRQGIAGASQRPGEESLWDVLADWARPGIAAGFLLATLAGAVLAARAARNQDTDNPVLAEASDHDELVGVVLGSTR